MTDNEKKIKNFCQKGKYQLDQLMMFCHGYQNSFNR